MRRSLFLGFLTAVLCVCATTLQAQAQATRTWVSGTGDDVNPCSRTAPCKTFAGASPKTAAGGEIDVLDPGGYGTLSITKALTIDGGGGIVASSLTSTTTSGPAIQINAGANDRITLRNLRLFGINQISASHGTNGVAFNSGLSLKVENLYIFGFDSYGINFQPSIRAVLTVVNTEIEGCGTFGGGTFGGGIIAATPATTGGFNRVTIRNTTVSTSISGVTAGQNTKIQLDHVAVAEGGVGGGGDYGLIASGPAGEMNVDYSTISGNQFGGIHALTGGTIRVANSSITDNNTNGILVDSGGAVQSYGNNRVASNAGLFAFMGTLSQN
jgi:hypothetical protein